MSVVKIVAKNTIAQGISKFVSILSSILLTILLTRSLGKAGFGEYTFITSLVLLFGTISDWGTNIVTVREASKDPVKSKSIFANAVAGRLILATGVFILFNFTIRINSDWSNIVQAGTVASLVLLALSLKTSTTMVFHAFQRLELASFVDLVASLLFVLFVFLIVWQGSSTSMVMFVWFFATLLAAALGIAISSKLFNFKEVFMKATVNVKSLTDFFRSKFLRDALPAGFLFVLSTVYNRVDILILQHFKGSEAVASYGLPYKVYDQAILVSAFLMASLFPILARSFSEDKFGTKLREYYQKTFDILLIVGLAGGLVLFFGSSFIVTLLGGVEYPESIQVLKLLSFAVLPSFLNHLTGYSLLAFGKQKLSLVIAVFALLLNVVLNLILVPRFSFYGSAVITLFTEVFVFVVSLVVVARVIKFAPSIWSFPSTLGQINRIYSK